MAKQVLIPITDEGADGVCTSFYSVRLKLVDDVNWAVLPNQFGVATGSPAVNNIILVNLIDDADYSVEITRNCCTGTQSTPVIINFTATNT